MPTNVGKFFPLPETPLTDGEAIRLARKLSRYACGEILNFEISRRVTSVSYSAEAHKINPDAGWREVVHNLAWLFLARMNPNARITHTDIDNVNAKLVREVYKRKYLDGRLKDKPKAPPTKKQKQSAAFEKVLAQIKQWESKRRRAVNALKKLERKRKYYQRQLDG